MHNRSEPLSSLPIPPSTLSALTKAGYETLDDIPSHESPNQLTDALKIPLKGSQTLFSSSQKFGGTSGPLPSTQSAAALISSRRRNAKLFSTRCPPVDSLLNGGLSQGRVLELSGPPGSPKDLVLLNLVHTFVEAKEKVLLVDCQNMCGAPRIDEYLRDVPGAPELVSYIKPNDLTDFMILMHNLPSYSNMSLLAISSISFPFQSTTRLSNAARTNLLEQVKQCFMKLTSQNVTVAVTSQLSTKLMNSDGSSGTFDSVGAKGVMVPQLGSTYLPSGKTYRILCSLENERSGSVRLLAYPPLGPGKDPATISTKSFEIHGLVLKDTEEPAPLAVNKRSLRTGAQ